MNQKLTVSNLGENESDYFSDNYWYDRTNQETRIIFKGESITPLCTCQTTHEFVLLVKELYKRECSILRDFKELNVNSILKEIRNKIGGKQNEN